MGKEAWLRWGLGLGIAAILTVIPYLAYRAEYTRHKRLREVTPGVLYRSGQMTVDGFGDAASRYHIRTIINLQDEYPDPAIRRGYFHAGTVPETELCRRLGVRYVHIQPDLIGRRRVPAERPRAIEEFLAVMDDPANYPVLVHCKAGLHRTGVMVAVYRMEYEGWTPADAMAELKANGFGDSAATSANDYITQYVLTYRPGERRLPRAAPASDDGR